MVASIQFESLSGNIEFKQILKSNKVMSNLFTIYYRKLDQELQNNKKVILSCVSAKKLGNAVKRNRAKRRMRALISLFLQENRLLFDDKSSYVIVAKKSLIKATFLDLRAEMKECLSKS